MLEKAGEGLKKEVLVVKAGNPLREGADRLQ